MKKNLFILLALVLVSCSQPLAPQVEQQPEFKITYLGSKIDDLDENDPRNYSYTIRNHILTFLESWGRYNIYGDYVDCSYRFQLSYDVLYNSFKVEYDGKPFNYGCPQSIIDKHHRFFNELIIVTTTEVKFDNKEEFEKFYACMCNYGIIRGCIDTGVTYTEEDVRLIEEKYIKPIIKAFKEYVNKNCTTK